MPMAFMAFDGIEGVKASRTIDSPILVFDYFELFKVLGIAPQVRRRHPKGVLLHWPCRKFHIFLPRPINIKQHGPRPIHAHPRKSLILFIFCGYF